MSHIRSTEYRDDEMQLARFAKALGHPARIAIMKFLSSNNACFCGDIVEELPIAQATVSQHLKELKSVGLIQGTIEPPKVRYCIDPEKWEYAQKLFSKFWKKSFMTIECKD
jgi:ArsR family transcriptional regulator, arsenate/arsenite/antimonite-responsive transcriptional repressor